MQSVNRSRQVNQFLVSILLSKNTQPPTNQQSAKHSVSLFAKTNQPTTDQLSKEGSRQPCSQSRQVSSVILVSILKYKNTKHPTNQQSANILSLFAKTNQPTTD